MVHAWMRSPNREDRWAMSWPLYGLWLFSHPEYLEALFSFTCKTSSMYTFSFINIGIALSVVRAAEAVSRGHKLRVTPLATYWEEHLKCAFVMFCCYPQSGLLVREITYWAKYGKAAYFRKWSFFVLTNGFSMWRNWPATHLQSRFSGFSSYIVAEWVSNS